MTFDVFTVSGFVLGMWGLLVRVFQVKFTKPFKLRMLVVYRLYQSLNFCIRLPAQLSFPLKDSNQINKRSVHFNSCFWKSANMVSLHR